MNNINLIEELGLQNAPEEKQKEILDRAGKLVMGNMMLKVIPMLSEEDQKELERLLDGVEKGTSNETQLWGFLSYKINDLDQILKEEVEKIRNELIGAVK